MKVHLDIQAYLGDTGEDDVHAHEAISLTPDGATAETIEIQLEERGRPFLSVVIAVAGERDGEPIIGIGLMDERAKRRLGLATEVADAAL